jgi:hypothetical protein
VLLRVGDENEIIVSSSPSTMGRCNRTRPDDGLCGPGGDPRPVLFSRGA